MQNKEKIEVDVRDKILLYLKDNERSLHWLAKKCEFNYNTFYGCFTYRHFDLSDEKLEKINQILETNFSR